MKRLIVAYDGPRGSMATNIEHFCSALPERFILCQHVPDVDLLGWNCLASTIANGYGFIVDNYEPGDKVFIFGFSRGAVAARAVACMVSRIGVLRGRRNTALPQAFTACFTGKLDDFKVKKISPNENYDFVEEDLIPYAYDVDVEVLGCWDTVANGGRHYEHLDTSLVKGIKHAFHALSLDECRGPFAPGLLHLPDDPEIAKSIDLQQCWFPGAHNNVGGGYPDRALTEITLAWMIDRCSPFLDFNSKPLNRMVAGARKPAERLVKPKGVYDTEYQGWGRGMCYDSYWEGHSWTWKTRTPGAHGSGTNEMMHPSVRERWMTSRERGLTTGPAVWNPKALEGFTSRQKEGSDEWEWVKDGDTALTILEAPFPTATESLEWRLRYEGEAVPSSTTAPKAVPKSAVGKIFSFIGYITGLTRPT